MENSAERSALEAALDQGERALVSDVVASSLAAGLTSRSLARLSWSWALSRGALETRGARWSHALFALAAASAIEGHLGSTLGDAAMINALDFLSFARPSRAGREVRREARWCDNSAWFTAIREGDLGQADAQLLDLLHRPDSRDQLSAAWFQAGCMSGAGWGHGAIGARTFWAVADSGLAPGEGVLRAGMRLWIPFEATQGLESGLQRWAALGLVSPCVEPTRPQNWWPCLGPGRPERMPARSELHSLSQAILEGAAERAFGEALLAGVPCSVLAASACVAACRIFVARPGLRQLHAITFSRAILDAVRVSAVDGRGPLWLSQAFVAESWLLALRSGRVRQAEHVLDQVEPGSIGTSKRASAIETACRVEATAVFGHTLKLCEACLDLESTLPESVSGWATAALVAAESTWPKGQRPWLALCRARSGGISSSSPHV